MAGDRWHAGLGRTMTCEVCHLLVLGRTGKLEMDACVGRYDACRDMNGGSGNNSQFSLISAFGMSPRRALLAAHCPWLVASRLTSSCRCLLALVPTYPSQLLFITDCLAVYSDF